MKDTVVKYALGFVGAAIGVLAVVAMREATLSVHTDMPADSRSEVVIDAGANQAERGKTVAEATTAQVLSCRLEVQSDVVGPIEQIDDDTFRFTLQPALDETDEKQFKGCVEDWRLDHFWFEVDQLYRR